MDTRRLSTGDVLAAGIISKPVPETDIPEDRPQCGYDVYEHDPDRDGLREALERGEVLYCPEYYGIPNLWKDGDIYRGVLLQYRAVSESPTFDSADEALDWFVETAHAVSG